MSSFIYILNKKERRVILLKKKKPKPKNWFRFSVAECGKCKTALKEIKISHLKIYLSHK